jgi:hypothetical protein
MMLIKCCFLKENASKINLLIIFIYYIHNYTGTASDLPITFIIIIHSKI